LDKKILNVHKAYSIYQICNGKPPSDIVLKSTEWAVITQLSDKKTVSDIAKILALTVEEAVALFSGLENKGLIKVISTRKPVKKIVSAPFFKRLENELLKIVGPVAPFLIEDALLEVGSGKNDFESEKIAELIEIISDEIADEEKKVEFQGVMLIQLKNMDIQ
jgi:hypothetical protein